jgi:trk system potassium uptake protein
MPSLVPKAIGTALNQRPPPDIETSRIGFVLGIQLLVLALFMIPPCIADLVASNSGWQVFAGSAFACGFVGLMLVISNRGSWPRSMSLREGFLLTTSSWLVLSVAAAIPFVLLEDELNLRLVDAWFESVSGLTTTGSTVISGLDALPPGILLWRSIIQWIGGIGVIVMAIIMLPFLKVGGMQLFHIESSERGEKFVPRAGELILLLVIGYVTLTTACMAGYIWAGMTIFDAVNHAMTTVATGGYSTHDLSFGHFSSPGIHWVAITFMFAASLPILLYAKAVRTGSMRVWGDQQVIGFFKLVLSAVAILTVWYMIEQGAGPGEALRIVALNAVSIVSTTGYALGDYTLWAPGASGIFFVLMFLGGCTGSTAGGMKTFRLQVMAITAGNYVKRLVSPHRVVIATYNGKAITSDISAAVLAFVTVMFAIVLLFTVALSIFDIDFTTALSAVTTAVTNVGPGLGPAVGPAGNFTSLPDGAKVLLAFAMILGRLEFFTVLVVFTPDFWR